MESGPIIYKTTYASETAAFFFPRTFLGGASFCSRWIACSADTRARDACSHISVVSICALVSLDESAAGETGWNNKGKVCARQRVGTSVTARKGLEGTQSDSDMVPQPAEFDRVRSGGMCSSKRVHAPLSYGRVTVQQSSNVVANNGFSPHYGGDQKKARDGNSFDMQHTFLKSDR